MPTFKLLRGRHVTGRAKERKTFIAGKNDVIVTRHNLLKFNGAGVTPKFRKISDEDLGPAQAQSTDMRNSQAPPPQKPEPNDALNDMTVDQLKKLADEEEIDISGAKTKAELIERIRAFNG